MKKSQKWNRRWATEVCYTSYVIAVRLDHTLSSCEKFPRKLLQNSVSSNGREPETYHVFAIFTLFTNRVHPMKAKRHSSPYNISFLVISSCRPQFPALLGALSFLVACAGLCLQVSKLNDNTSLFFLHSHTLSLSFCWGGESITFGPVLPGCYLFICQFSILPYHNLKVAYSK